MKWLSITSFKIAKFMVVAIFYAPIPVLLILISILDFFNWCKKKMGFRYEEREIFEIQERSVNWKREGF
jgi:uncharacterized membrane protein